MTSVVYSTELSDHPVAIGAMLRSGIFYVYELRDCGGRPFYVGKGSRRRIFNHEIHARNGKHSPVCCKIRHLWKHGGVIHKVIVFVSADETAAFDEERRLIAMYGRDNLTNQTDGGDGPANPSDAIRAKIAASRRGCQASPETRAKQRAAKLGVPRSQETKDKIAAYQRGRQHPWASLPKSAEHQRKITAALTGRKAAPGIGAKISAAKMGHVVSEETRRKISASKKGRPSPKKGRKNPPRTVALQHENTADQWIDLPAGSFKSEGTNVNAAIVVFDR